MGVLNDGPHHTVAVDAAGATDPTNGFVREAVGPLPAEPNVTHEAEGANESITFQEKIMRIVCLIYLFRIGIRSLTSQPIVTLSTSGNIENGASSVGGGGVTAGPFDRLNPPLNAQGVPGLRTMAGR